MIFRLLLLAALAWIAWRLLQHFTRAQTLQPPPQQDHFEPMERCQKCGTHLPARALSSDGRCGRCSE